MTATFRRTPRGAGVGLEVTATVVRGVRLVDPDELTGEHGGPARVAAAAEAPITRTADDDATLDALVRVLAQLEGAGTATRIAWFPTGSTMQRIDATGLTGTELNALRHHLVDHHGIDSTMLVELGARRWMLALRWDHRAAGRLEVLAERAGFVDPSVEPGPVALGRCLPAATPVARRDAAADQSWAAIYDTGTPIAATAVPAASRQFPGLALAGSVVGLHRLDEVLTAPALGEGADDLTPSAMRDFPSESALRVVGESYPPYPGHDLRSASRLAVSLGAAIGASGLAGPARPVDVLSPVTVGDQRVMRPWAIERIAEAPVLRRPTQRRPRSRWARRLRR